MMNALVPLLLAIATVAESRKITVINQCGTTIWPGMHTGGNAPPSHKTGWEMVSGATEEFDVPENWTAGRIWARTGCEKTPDGLFQCLTGSCGKGPGSAGEGGDINCINTNEPPSTLAEFTLEPAGADWYDVSLVDGFNIPMTIIPSKKDCERPSCGVNINTMCPPVLRTGIDTKGRNLGCIHACNAGFGKEPGGNRACCSGSYNDPNACAICGVDYYALFKDNCKTSYAYAYDEKSETALWRCGDGKDKPSDYTIIFCPGGTDYVGLATPTGKYLSATATCSSMVKYQGPSVDVGPSPSVLQTNKLPIQATAATGLDGAAAYQSETKDGGGKAQPAATTNPVTTNPAPATNPTAPAAAPTAPPAGGVGDKLPAKVDTTPASVNPGDNTYKVVGTTLFQNGNPSTTTTDVLPGKVNHAVDANPAKGSDATSAAAPGTNFVTVTTTTTKHGLPSAANALETGSSDDNDATPPAVPSKSGKGGKKNECKGGQFLKAVEAPANHKRLAQKRKYWK